MPSGLDSGHGESHAWAQAQVWVRAIEAMAGHWVSGDGTPGKEGAEAVWSASRPCLGPPPRGGFVSLCPQGCQASLTNSNQSKEWARELGPRGRSSRPGALAMGLLPMVTLQNLLWPSCPVQEAS